MHKILEKSKSQINQKGRLKQIAISLLSEIACLQKVKVPATDKNSCYGLASLYFNDSKDAVHGWRVTETS